MFKIDLKSKKSIYEQIVDGFKGEIVSGARAADSKIPSVRELAATLTVNPNTIQKAYSELEKQGYIYSVSGRGNFVSEVSEAVDEVQAGNVFAQIEGLIKELRYLGVAEEEIIRRINEIIIQGSLNAERFEQSQDARQLTRVTDQGSLNAGRFERSQDDRQLTRATGQIILNTERSEVND